MTALKVLVVGYGSIGKRYVDNLSKIPNIDVIICTKKNIKLNSKYATFVSLDDCIACKPDVAIIANVTSAHTDTALRLAKAGIHLLIEKPLSNSMRGIEQLVDIINKKKLITLVGCNLRFHESITTIKQLLSSNAIGRVISAYAESGSYLPDWHPYEDYRQSYASRKSLGGGVVLTCIHEIDYLCWFFGQAKEVYSITGKYSDLDVSADDLSATLIKFKNNIVAQLHLDYFQRPDFRCCKIVGTKGTIYWDSTNNSVRVYDVKRRSWKTKLKVKNYKRNTMYEKELVHFIDCVKKRKQTVNPISQGRETLKIALAIHKSAKTKRMCVV